MTFFKFGPRDIIDSFIEAHPSHAVQLNGHQVTGSIFLERKYLETSLSDRLHIRRQSDALADPLFKQGPFSSSVDIIDAERGATNQQLYESLENLVGFYKIVDDGYALEFTGSISENLRVITVPEIYFDREILTGSFSASDLNSAGASRDLFDNGRGGIYSGSLSGTLVGNIFYSEGLISLTKQDLLDFGEASPTNFKWKVDFKGVHKIPTKIFRCRAPAGQLNASTNPTYFQIPTGLEEDNKNLKEIVLPEPKTYITTVGLFDEDFELVGIAKTSQPIRKEEAQDILFRIRLDF